MRALLLVPVCLLSGLALLFLLPWLKEGYDVEELPMFAAILAALLALAWVTWLGLRRRRGLLVVGLGCLTPPVAAYALLVSDIAWDEWRGRSLSRTVRVLSLRETPIEWPGFLGPVGLRLEIELEHEVRAPGNLFSPRLRMAGKQVPARGDYFAGAAFGATDGAFLEVPLFQRGPSDGPRLDGSPARLSFDVYPSKVMRYEAGRKVCFSRWDAKLVPRGAAGQELSACWIFVGRNGVVVDMSAPLTAALRAGSALQGRRAAWDELLARLEPASLTAHGFLACGDEGSGERCYCRADGARPQ